MRMGAFADEEHERDAERRGNDRDPQQWTELLPDELVQAETDERSDDGARGVGRAVKSERAAPVRGCGVVRDDRVTRRASYTFADPIGDAGREHHRPRVRERKKELAERRQAVTGADQRSTVPQVGEATRDGFHRGGGPVGEALDQTQHRRRRAQHAGHEERQDRIEHL